MEDDWLPPYELDANELCYGIPTDTKNILSLTQKIINSPFVDNFQGFDLEILLEFDQLDDELWEEEPEIIEYEISSLTESLRGRIESLLEEAHRRFGLEGDISGWADGFAVVAEYTEDRKKLIDCLKFLVHQPNFLEYCTVSVSFYLNPVSTFLDDPGFIAVCEEIEKRTGGEFSIRGKAELGPYDGIEAGSSFYQLYLLVSPHYEFPLRFFRGHSEDNRLASSYYHYVFSRICRSIDCKLTLLKT
ncbi:MAG: hypothetical protein HXS44_15625 [Theionarchaea archaeon]|nr:hypothetical protein [Theionarchaea archaeon]